MRCYVKTYNRNRTFNSIGGSKISERFILGSALNFDLQLNVQLITLSNYKFIIYKNTVLKKLVFSFIKLLLNSSI